MVASLSLCVSLNMPDIFDVQIFDCLFIIVREGVNFYIRAKDLYDFLGIRRIEETNLVFKHFQDFKIKDRRVSWNAKFLNFESVRSVIDGATCCRPRKEILWNGLEHCISKIMSVMNSVENQSTFKEQPHVIDAQSPSIENSNRESHFNPDRPSTSREYDAPALSREDSSNFENNCEPSTSKDMSVESIKEILHDLKIKNLYLRKNLSKYNLM